MKPLILHDTLSWYASPYYELILVIDLSNKSSSFQGNFIKKLRSAAQLFHIRFLNSDKNLVQYFFV